MATIRIPAPLRRYTNGAEEVAATGATVAAIIDDLGHNYAGLKERLCDEEGNVRRFVNLYVNDEDIRFLQSMDTPVSDSDELSIVPAIAGGRLDNWSSVLQELVEMRAGANPDNGI